MDALFGASKTLALFSAIKSVKRARILLNVTLFVFILKKKVIHFWVNLKFLGELF